jgi:hypothetical protein
MRFLLLLCMAMAGIAVGNEARAAAARDYEVTYYAEPQLQTWVGTFEKPCGTGAATMMGHRTHYFTKSLTGCLGGVGGIQSPTISCHFTQRGCDDALAHALPVASRAPSMFQVRASDRELFKKNQRASGIKGK